MRHLVRVRVRVRARVRVRVRVRVRLQHLRQGMLQLRGARLAGRQGAHLVRVMIRVRVRVWFGCALCVPGVCQG